MSICLRKPNEFIRGSHLLEQTDTYCQLDFPIRIFICSHWLCKDSMCSFRFRGAGAGAGCIRRVLNRSKLSAPCAARDAGRGQWFSHPASSSRRLRGRGDTYRPFAPGAANQDRRKFHRRSSFIAIAAHIIICFRFYRSLWLCIQTLFNIHQQFLLVL